MITAHAFSVFCNPNHIGQTITLVSVLRAILYHNAPVQTPCLRRFPLAYISSQTANGLLKLFVKHVSFYTDS